MSQIDQNQDINFNTELNNSKRSRRNFLVRLLQTTGITVFGGLLWAGYVNEAKSSPLTIKPPGALEGDSFLAACSKCGLCVTACQEKVGKENYPLRLAKPGDNKPVGAPYFIPREKPCVMCPDLPCVEACPTGALDQKQLTDKDSNKFDINLARMGLAVVDRESCVAYWGIQCKVCYVSCPIIDKAITLDYVRNKRTGKHAFLMPIVHSDYCTGCGICEKACITEKASIFVLPRKIVMGKPGTNYIKGWDKKDESRLRYGPDRYRTKTKKSERDVLDTLNEEVKTDD